MTKLPEKDQTFAKSLIKQLGSRGLSIKQAEWVEKLLDRAVLPAKPKAQIGNMSKLIEMFDFAQTRLKFPKITIGDDHVTVRLNICGDRSKYKGAINVCTLTAAQVSEEDDTLVKSRNWVGRIERSGEYTEAFSVAPETQASVIALLRSIALNPRQAVELYAKKSGNCALCNKPLTDPKSVARGIGPVCFSNFGLS